MHKAPLTQTFAFIVSLVPLNMIWANDNAVSPEQRSTPAVQVTAAAVATTVAPDTLQGLPGRIEFTSVRHDFGTVTRGSRVTHSYEFVNAGKGVLHVRSIHATCGCVNTRVEPSVEFLPGQKGKITFEFDSTNFADSIVRTLTVDTDTPPPSTVIHFHPSCQLYLDQIVFRFQSCRKMGRASTSFGLLPVPHQCDR